MCVSKAHSSTTHKNIFLGNLLPQGLEPFALTSQESRAKLFLFFTHCLVVLSFPKTLTAVKVSNS